MDAPRTSERKRTMLGAHIIFNNRNSTMDCQVRNISPTGARLALSDTVALPEEFDLHVPQKGKTYRAKLRWRNNDSVGVELVADQAPAQAPPQAPRQAQADLGQRVAELETENATLRLQVFELLRKFEKKDAPVAAGKAA